MSVIVVRQSTARTVMLGPFLDKTDGVTEEVGLAGGGTELSKNGATFGAGPTLGTHDSEGYYPISLSTSHTDTVGSLLIKSHDSATHLPVWQRCIVLEEAVYDAMYAASAPGYLQPTTAGRTLDVSATGEAGLDWANIGSPTTSQTLSGTTVGTATNLTNAPTSGDLTATMKTSVENAVLNADMTSHQTQGTLGQAIGDPVADTNTIYKAVVTDAAGATVGVDVVAVQADTDDIQTRLPAALVSGRMSSDAVAISGSTAAADSVEANIGNLDATVSTRSTVTTAQVNTEVDTALADIGLDHLVSAQGTADSGTTTTLVDAALTEADNYWNDSVLLIVSGTIAGQARLITDFDAASDTVTVSHPFTSAVGTNNYVILPAGFVGLFTQDMTQLTGEASRSLLNAVRFLRNKWSIAAGTLTVTKEDDTTSAWTSALTTDAAADPVTASDPA